MDCGEVIAVHLGELAYGCFSVVSGLYFVGADSEIRRNESSASMPQDCRSAGTLDPEIVANTVRSSHTT